MPFVHATEPISLTIDFETAFSLEVEKLDPPEMIVHAVESGAFEMSDDFSDSGSVTATSKVEVCTPDNSVKFKSIYLLKGAFGKLEISVDATGIFLPPPDFITECSGEWTIISDTRNYKGLRGDGVFTSVIDWATDTITGSFIGMED
jgi:hypothetical protein